MTWTNPELTRKEHTQYQKRRDYPTWATQKAPAEEELDNYAVVGHAAPQYPISQRGTYINVYRNIAEEPAYNPLADPRRASLDRVHALRNIAVARIIMDGASEETDMLLERCEKVAVAEKPLSYSVPENIQVNREKVEALCLHSNPANAQSTLTDTYLSYLRSSMESPRGVPAGSPGYGNPFIELDQAAALAKIAKGELAPEEYARQELRRMGAESTDSPEFNQFYAQACFDYASTLPDCPEKTDWLFNAIVYSDQAYHGAKEDDHKLHFASLNIHARALNDIAYMPGSLDRDNAAHDRQLRDEARVLAPVLLNSAAEIFALANPIEGNGDYAETRYFETLYANCIRTDGIDAHAPTGNIEHRLIEMKLKQFGHAALLGDWVKAA